MTNFLKKYIDYKVQQNLHRDIERSKKLKKHEGLLFVIISICSLSVIFLIDKQFFVVVFVGIIITLIVKYFQDKEKKDRDKYSVFYNELKNPNHPYKEVLMQLLKENDLKNSYSSKIFPEEIFYQNTIFSKFFSLPIGIYIAILMGFFIIFLIFLEYLKVQRFEFSFSDFWVYSEIIFSIIVWIFIVSLWYFAYIRRKTRIEKIFWEYEKFHSEWFSLYNIVSNKKFVSKNDYANPLIFALIVTKISDNFIFREKNLQKISKICKNIFLKRIYDLEFVTAICENQKHALLSDVEKMKKIIANWAMMESQKISNISQKMEENRYFILQKERFKILEKNLEKLWKGF